ncbi:MAG: S8 family serine peptidase [Alphaproteobacteria bacterium]|nr:S8 family serine peptidase [Alphaproteobacteria bacterium]
MAQILRAVQANHQGVCRRTGAGKSRLARIDSDAPVRNAELRDLTEEPFVKDEVIASIPGDGDNITQIADAAGLGVLSRRRSALLNAFLVRFIIPDGRSVSQVVVELANDDRVGTVAPQHIFEAQADELESSRFVPEKLSLPAISKSLTGKSVRVAVIDTAVDRKHPALKGAVAATFDAFPGKTITDRSHGTSIAGLIAGRRSVRGVAPKARLLIARAFDDFGRAKSSGTASHLVDSLDWAIGKKARIVNMSFAGPRNAVFSKALSAAAKSGAVLIAAAGNNGPKASAAYPAADPAVLAVTATDIKDSVYSRANAGSYVFIAAPGVDVLVPTAGGGVDFVQGTSFAGALVSGIVALLLEKEPQRSPRDVAQDLSRAARDLGAPGRDATFGVGLANAALTVGGAGAAAGK